VREPGSVRLREPRATLHKRCGFGVQADPLLRQQYAKKACAAGSKTYCEVDKLLGTLDSSGSTAARGNALFQSKCDAGDALACGLLGEDLLGGIGIGADRERGITLLKLRRLATVGWTGRARSFRR
jgi:TPR repeat protein